MNFGLCFFFVEDGIVQIVAELVTYRCVNTIVKITILASFKNWIFFIVNSNRQMRLHYS
ncbi:hypothetical protein HanXRQr2_Chr03g0105361 [Helianthus annuus]|uniref:Uncharacterized protein n=1 Tax=Helianthus annuus TaxID=4232 RepID=A0A9K3JF59_HELAN|nr:hypothetical protein HanXRQr2_Chr03g0105361 [Helianthus annuus]KAJ0943249.1 hypothetical protein HanPSC8_Chr03g0101891 [Helianthus annuus]